MNDGIMDRIWVSQEEYVKLGNIVSSLSGSGCIVELGTFRGGTTQMFAEHTPDNISIWSIDIYKFTGPWKDSLGDYNAVTIWEKYFKDKFNNVFFIVGDSLNVGKYWDKPIEFLFLDADHVRAITKSNFVVWDKNIVPGGYAVFHDNVWNPPLIPEILSEYPNYDFISEFDITGVIRKKRHEKYVNNWWNRLYWI